MAELVSLAAMKRHLRLEEFNDDDDEYIATLTVVARRSCEKQIGRTVVGEEPEIADAGDLLLVSHAMMMLVGGWYANREAVSSGVGSAPVEMPMAVRWLLEPLRRLVV